MNANLEEFTTTNPVHAWLRRIRVAFVPGFTTPLLEEVASGLLHQFRLHGHQVQATPDDDTDIILTTAPFGEPIGWRKALLFTARRRFNLNRSPVIYTLVHVSLGELQRLLDHFRAALAKEPHDPKDYDFPGLASRAHRVLFKQGHRGGPILALERVVQAQAKSIHIILIVGDDRPLMAYHFDLVGAHPRSEAEDMESFYKDIVLRIATIVSTRELTDHEVKGEPIPSAVWRRLSTPAAMSVAGRRLGERSFFTEMVRIADLVRVPAVHDAVASQYSEGCFATWDPTLDALIATVTGSARPVDKGSITDDDLAVIVGVRPDGSGSLTRRVEGKRNDPPSSEAVEMMDMDSPLPSIALDSSWDVAARVPVVRSKLHGHRGIAAYDLRRVECAPLDPPYYYYPVSCATDAQARGIKDAFARSEALQDPDDPRQVVFTVLPTHGVVIVEKWVNGKAPFQVMWEYMDAGYLQVDSFIPQGLVEYLPGPDGGMVLQTAESAPTHSLRRG
jgi:hypothetical protein